MKYEMTLFHTMGPNGNGSFQTHLLLMTIFGLMWSSFNIGWCSCAPVSHWLCSITLFSNAPPLSRHPLGRHPAGRHPLSRHPQADTLLSRHPLGRHPPMQTSPLGRHPPGQTPPGQTPSTPRHSHCNGQYAFYWNAFLFGNMSTAKHGITGNNPKLMNLSEVNQIFVLGMCRQIPREFLRLP